MIRFIYTPLLFLTTLSLADEGALLFNGNCATCHHIKEASSAPTINAVRSRYLQAFPQKNDFINYLSTWVYKPSKKTSLMHDMIEKYGVMPELAFDKESLKIIAKYIYEGKIEATTR